MSFGPAVRDRSGEVDFWFAKADEMLALLGDPDPQVAAEAVVVGLAMASAATDAASDLDDSELSDLVSRSDELIAAVFSDDYEALDETVLLDDPVFEAAVDGWCTRSQRVDRETVDLAAWTMSVLGDGSNLSGVQHVVCAVALDAAPVTVGLSVIYPRGLSGRFVTVTVPGELAAHVCKLDPNAVDLGPVERPERWLVAPEVRVADLLEDDVPFVDVLARAVSDDELASSYGGDLF